MWAGDKDFVDVGNWIFDLNQVVYLCKVDTPQEQGKFRAVFNNKEYICIEQKYQKDIIKLMQERGHKVQ